MAQRLKQFGVAFLMPQFFSETRFANHVIRVYRMFRETYPALIISLEEIQNMLMNSPHIKERDKARKAADISGTIFNLTFALSLSLLCDIYNKYSQLVCILQVKPSSQRV